MSTDLEQFLGGKTATAKFTDGQFGQVIGGEIVAEPKMVQQRDYDTDELMVYPDGNPQMQMIVKVQAQPATQDDDGTRAFYVKNQLREAVIEALKAAGEKVPRVGGKLWVKYLSDEPVTLKNGKPGKNKKIHAAKYTPPTGAAGAFLADPATPAVAPASTFTAPAGTNPAATVWPSCPPGVDTATWGAMNSSQRAQMYTALGLPFPGAAAGSNGTVSQFTDEPPF